MPTNGRHYRREKKCSVCDLTPIVLEEVDARLAAGQRNADITRWMRQAGHTPPTRHMLDRHRTDRHYLGDRVITESSDNSIAAGHSGSLNLMQRVQLNVAHTLLPRLALVPKNLNILEEMQELYVFTKNQLAIEFEISQSTPEIYEHPVTGESQLITPTSPGMVRLIKEMRAQLKDIDESSKNVMKGDDITAQLVINLMAEIKANDAQLEEIEGYISQTAEFVDAEVVDEAEEE